MFTEVISKINKAEKIAIFNHINPDGDAFGSAFGLKLALMKLGKQAEVFLREGDENCKEYQLLKGTEKGGIKIEDCDLKIAVDCADLQRLGIFADIFDGETIAIDHHVTHKSFANTTIVVADAPATGEVIFNLVKEMGVELCYDIAYNLYMAIVCDTGNFKFSSTTAKTHFAAAELIDAGIDFADMTKQLFDTKTMEYLDMYKMGIERLELHHKNTIAVLCFSDADFAEAGISESDADAIVNLPNSISGVEVGVYIRSRGDGFKVSLRSNGKVNVAEIATGFGGGGHQCASGFSLNLPMEEVKKVVVEKLSAVINVK